MKRRITSLLLAFVCVFSILQLQQSTQVRAWNHLSLNATVTSKTKVKLSWKKKNVSSYRVYRASLNKNGDCGKFKRIATLSRSKTSYTNSVSYKKYYRYEVRGYNSKGKLIYSGENDVFSGVSNVSWAEYQWCDAKISPSAIPLEWNCDNGLRPTGYEVYRSENGKTFKKLKTLKNVYKYTDKSVKAKHTYYYKIRAYRTLSGKKIYGAYSEPVKHSAVNKDGKYSVELLPGNVASSSAISGASVIAPILTSPGSISMIVTSKKMNGNLKLDSHIYWDTCFTFKAADGTEQTKFGTATSHLYRSNGTDWQEVEDKKVVTLKPNETFYLRFDFEKTDLMGDIASASSVSFDSFYGGVEYNGFKSNIYFTIPEDNVFSAVIDGERYH